jgi:hypothetical protein
MPNTRVELSLKSFPKRNVILSLKLVNDDAVDYYFNSYNVASHYSGRIYINNTLSTRRHSGIKWERCTDYTCPPEAEISDYDKIPALGTFTKEVNIKYRCSFLNKEPLGYKHWLRFEASAIPLEDSPMGNWIGGVSIPTVTELPFILLDEEDVRATFTEEVVMDSSIAGAAAAAGSCMAE